VFCALAASLVFAAVPALADTAPTVTVDPASAVAYTTAHVSGTVNPNGGPSAVAWIFEYSKNPGEEGWTPAGGGELTGTEAEGTTPIAVQATLTGLAPNTTYEVRIVATNAGGEGVSAEPNPSFTTKEVTKPTATAPAVSAVTGESAHFAAWVDPNAPGGAPGQDPGFNTPWHFQCTPECPGLTGGEVEADDTAHQVAADATGLLANVTYAVSLLASNQGGTTTAGPVSFKTTAVKPTIEKEAVTALAATSATLTATVNPNGSATTCSFEYGTTTGYEHSVPCATQPGSGHAAVPVSQTITGLTTTTYHWRVLATNAAGTTPSVDHTFLDEPAPPAPSGGCPNEQLRIEDHSTALPDCRSYEMVTPPFTSGDPITSTNEGFAVALDSSGEAEALGFQSIGGFGGAGNDGATSGSTYVARRGSTGWSSTQAGASATEFENNQSAGQFEVSDFNSSLTTGLFFAAPLSAATPLEQSVYAQSVGGKAVEVGPVIEPAKAATFTAEDEKLNLILNYAGGAGDLSHVFFYVRNRSGRERNWFWSWDTTTATTGNAIPTLYEYSGGGSREPELVGVRGGRGSHELTSQCGVILGGANLSEEATPAPNPGDGYNAIAADGTRVFFTAAGASIEHTCDENSKQERFGTGPLVNEIYARVPSSAPGELETVPISEPSEEQCRACRTAHSHVTVIERSAVFEGANQEGTKVFFLSTQELLPGASGDNLYEYDFNAPQGEKVSLVAPAMASSEHHFAGMARVSETGAMVYFVSEAVLAPNRDGNGKSVEEADKEAKEAGEPSDNLYAFNTVSRRFVFIARLRSADSQDWRQEDGRPVQATLEGSFVVFQSIGNLTPGAEAQGAQVYRYDARAGEAGEAGALKRVSIGQHGSYPCSSTGKVEAGFNCDGNVAASASLPSVSYANSVGHSLLTAITTDGSIVFFNTPAALTPGAQNDACAFEVGGSCEVFAQNAYEWERAGVGSCSAAQPEGCVYLISDGQGDHAVLDAPQAKLLGADPSGNNVFFLTSHALVGQDVNGPHAIYDARVGGGFPAPVAPVVCASECQGPAGPSPVFGAPGSATVTGPGNLAPLAPASPVKPAVKKVARCKRGFTRKKRRCVRVKRRKHGRAKSGKATHKSAHGGRG
jgi:hypothetical protein